MALGKRPQTNAMLYTLITFVLLFVIATILAIVAYLKAENYRNEVTTLKSQRDELATNVQVQKIGAIVGAKQPGKSRLATTLAYIDHLVTVIIGGVPEETSAEVKIDTVNRKVQDTLDTLPPEYLDMPLEELNAEELNAEEPNTEDPNAEEPEEELDEEKPDVEDPNAVAGILRVIEKLKIKLDNLTDARINTEEQLKNLQDRFDDAMTAGFEKEHLLLAEKEQYQQLVDDIKKDYSDLKEMMKQSADQQLQTTMAQLEEERENRRQIHQQLLKTQAELTIAQNRMQKLQQDISAIVPPPDTEAMAYKPDGKVILVDNATKIVHINLGSNDRVYRGLTFSIYDRNTPIPKDGKGKAEVEVFNVSKNISAARIIRSNIKNPIILDDIVANLIWDSEKANVFVIAGDFDLNGDGQPDYDAADKIKALIEKWGGQVQDNISIDTDFLVLGEVPQVLKKPSFEEMEVEPMAMERYEASLKQLAHYKDVQTQAQSYSIPVFNTERFLYFIGYKGQSQTPGAFEF